MNNVKKWRRTTESEKLKIASRKLEVSREHFMQRGMIKDRNRMDLTEAEEIKKWQEYTEDLYKEGLNDPDSHDGVSTQSQTSCLKSGGP